MTVTEIDDLLGSARASVRALAASSTDTRNACLDAIARALEAATAHVLAENAQDLADGRAAGLTPQLLDRLALDPGRVRAMIRALAEVRELPDPLAERVDLGVRPNGLRISRQRIPLGLLAIVYEARPNVTIEAAALAIKSGNAVVLRGGKEAARSNAALVACVREGLRAAGLPEGAVGRVSDPSRERVAELLGAVGRVDLVIPRGGESLMKMVDAHARVPVLRHGQGICHVFLDASADPAMASEIPFNAKVQRPAVCNAAETLLVHADLLTDGRFVRVARHLVDGGHVALRTDARAGAALSTAGIPHTPATDADWDTEYGALVMAVRVVDGIEDALTHIDAHGSHHTASIVTADEAIATRFLREVDASCVLWNASTRFNDGGELGLGAEMGISTTKMHAYGPMGLRELTAQKFVVVGTGQVRG